VTDELKDGILGIDPGDKRIGLAIARQGLNVAAGLGFIVHTSKRRMLEELGRIIKEENVGLVVIGLPLNMDGSEGESAKKSRRLAELIKREFGLRVDFEDERLTTDQALRLLRESGIKPGEKKGTVDMMAAITILQNYLDYRNPSD